MACSVCRTPHHTACMAELGGCTVLGCTGAQARPESSVEEVRARLRERVRRLSGSLREPDATGSAARQRGISYVCRECGVEFELFACPRCAGRLLESCGGGGVHCERPACASFYRGLRPGYAVGSEGGRLQAAREAFDPIGKVFLGLVLVSLAILILFRLIGVVRWP